MFNRFLKRDLKDVLNDTKSVKVGGVIFEIRKISPIDHLKGVNVLHAEFDVYRMQKEKLTEPSLKKIQQHYRDVFLSSVVKPKLSVDGSGDTISVDELFREIDIYERLYAEIMLFTYGKKKMKYALSQNLERMK